MKDESPIGDDLEKTFKEIPTYRDNVARIQGLEYMMYRDPAGIFSILSIIVCAPIAYFFAYSGIWVFSLLFGGFAAAGAYRLVKRFRGSKS